MKWTSDLGGLMGIWFGASFASIVEIIELISDLLMIALKNKYVSQVNPESLKPTTTEELSIVLP